MNTEVIKEKISYIITDNGEICEVGYDKMKQYLNILNIPTVLAHIIISYCTEVKEIEYKYDFEKFSIDHKSFSIDHKSFSIIKDSISKNINIYIKTDGVLINNYSNIICINTNSLCYVSLRFGIEWITKYIEGKFNIGTRIYKKQDKNNYNYEYIKNINKLPQEIIDKIVIKNRIDVSDINIKNYDLIEEYHSNDTYHMKYLILVKKDLETVILMYTIYYLLKKYKKVT